MLDKLISCYSYSPSSAKVNLFDILIKGDYSMSTEYTKLSAKYNQLTAEERGKIETAAEAALSR